MRGLFAGLLKARRALVPKAGVMIQQHARSAHGKPPKDEIGPLETVFVLTVMSATILGPSGWILVHLSEYKGSN